MVPLRALGSVTCGASNVMYHYANPDVDKQLFCLGYQQIEFLTYRLPHHFNINRFLKRNHTCEFCFMVLHSTLVCWVVSFLGFFNVCIYCARNGPCRLALTINAVVHLLVHVAYCGL